MNIVHKLVRGVISRLSYMNPDLLKLFLTNSSARATDLSVCLEDAATWLCWAQDATPDGGVSRSFSLVYNSYLGKRGWMASYPETTGYIIPTFFNYAKLTGNKEYFDRAVRMAEWEVQVQLQSGAVQGGMIGQAATPAIFNTGQVIFGWVRAYRETDREEFLIAATRAAEFLLETMEADGSWRKNLSDYVSSSTPFFSFNSRTAWALYLAGLSTNRSDFIEVATRNINFTISQQQNNGWFKNNCLSNPDQPFLHTIAYCIRGILEVAMLSKNGHFLSSAQKAADALLELQQTDGGLAGRYNENWQPTVSWSCLTGDAQTSIIWGKLYLLTKKDKYFSGMKKINKYLMEKQINVPQNKDIHGGITGSYPLNGDYGRYDILNWAVKFYMDALMLQDEIETV